MVVLPQPEGPSRAKNSPAGTVRSRGWTAWKSPKLLLTWSSVSSEPRDSSSRAGVESRVSCAVSVLMDQLPIACWKAWLYRVSSSGVSERMTWALERYSSVGKIMGFSASSGSVFSISSRAPSTGQM